MPRSRGSIPAPSARDSRLMLTARLYSSHWTGPITRPVPTSVPTPVSAPSSTPSISAHQPVFRAETYDGQTATRHPWVEELFQDRLIQPFIHDAKVTISERGRSHSFMIFFQNHVRLPVNDNLDNVWKGDILVMRLGRGKLRGEVVNLQTGDTRRTRKVIARFLGPGGAKQGRHVRLPKPDAI